jgi:hypothetical protein
VRVVEPARAVWVDLAALFPATAGATERAHPGGLDLTGLGRGWIQRWHRTSAGAWLPWVLVELHTTPCVTSHGEHPGMVTHMACYVPVGVVRPRNDDDPVERYLVRRRSAED